MASIAGPGSTYKEGHKVILKDLMAVSSKEKFREKNYIAGKSIFSLVNEKKNIKVDVEIVIKNQPQYILLKDDKGKIVKIVASYSGINGLFNHAGGSSKADTNKKTELKELVSMYLFENPKLTEEEIVKKLKKNPLYKTMYYKSAKLQLEEFEKIPKNNLNSYHFERQAKAYTKNLYKVGIKLSHKAADNWNPADVWMIDKKLASHIDRDLKVVRLLTEINEYIASNMYNKLLIPISLKQVEKKAKLSLIDPDKLLKTVPSLDLRFDKIDFSESFFNFIITTKADLGFGFRAGFKASKTTMNVSIEGRYIKAGYQAGAIDAKEFPSFIKKEFGYSVRTGSKTKIDIKLALKELKKVNVLPSKITSFKILEERLNTSNDFIKQRFCNIVSYIYAFLAFDFDKVSKFCYYSSKKITKAASAYYLIY